MEVSILFIVRQIETVCSTWFHDNNFWKWGHIWTSWFCCINQSCSNSPSKWAHPGLKKYVSKAIVFRRIFHLCSYFSNNGWIALHYLKRNFLKWLNRHMYAYTLFLLIIYYAYCLYFTVLFLYIPNNCPWLCLEWISSCLMLPFVVPFQQYHHS